MIIGQPGKIHFASLNHAFYVSPKYTGYNMDIIMAWDKFFHLFQSFFPTMCSKRRIYYLSCSSDVHEQSLTVKETLPSHKFIITN